MGKIDLSKLGISGKIGPIVAYVTKDGKQVYRKYTKPANPQTPKQQAQRQRFSVATKGLSPFKVVFKQGFPKRKKALSSQVSFAMREAIVGEYPDFRLDYSILQVAEGELQMPVNVLLSIDEANRTLRFSWDPMLVNTTLPGRADDHVNVVYLNEKEKIAQSLRNVAKRKDGTAIIDLKAESGNWNLEDMHFWIYLSSFILGENSESIYVRFNTL